MGEILEKNGVKFSMRTFRHRSLKNEQLARSGSLGVESMIEQDLIDKNRSLSRLGGPDAIKEAKF